MPPVVFLPLGVVLLVAAVYGLSELDARRKGVDPIASNADREAIREERGPGAAPEDVD